MVPPIKEPSGWEKSSRLVESYMIVGSEWSTKEVAMFKDINTETEEIEEKKDIEKMHFIV